MDDPVQKQGPYVRLLSLLYGRRLIGDGHEVKSRGVVYEFVA